MKKLMTIACAVAFAAAAQAGTYVWGFGSGMDEAPAGGYLESGTAMLFLGTVGETLNADGTYTLNFGTLTPTATDGQNPDTYTFGAYSYPDNTASSDAVLEAGGQAYSLILFSESNVADYKGYKGSYFLVTGDSLSMPDPEHDEIHYADMTFNSAVTTDMWKTASAVPEPTSGLLLLLGMAGLALRRRRA